MIIELMVPQLSESVAEPTLLAWLKKVGKAVNRHENLIDITTHQVVLQLPALADRVLVNIISSVNSRERSGINTILHELNPLFTINVTMRDIKSKNVYSRVNSKATTQWRKTESANGVHLERVASDNRSS